MTPEEIEAFVDKKIRQHEVRVALVSGLMGLVLLAGTFHAIRLAAVLH